MKPLTQSKELMFVPALNKKKSAVTQLLFKTLPLLLLLSSEYAPGEMTLNFNLGSNNSYFYPGACNMSNVPTYLLGDCGISPIAYTAESDPDTTPFFQGTYTDPVTFERYWHMIVGDPSTGFAMESYIPRIFSYESTSGGRPSRIMSWGSVTLEDQSGNGWDPLGINPSRDFDYTGNGTADPTKVIMRQIMGGTWNSTTQTWSCDNSDQYCSEFLKDQFLFKPKITQKINESDMVQNFVLDMSSITYSDDITTGSIINTLTITDPGMPDFDPTAGDFQMIDSTITISHPASGSSNFNPNITGGRYTYTQCSNSQTTVEGIEHCWQDRDINTWDYQEGSYSYVNGGAADIMSYEWDVYWDPSQNSNIAGIESKCANGLISGC